MTLPSILRWSASVIVVAASISVTSRARADDEPTSLAWFETTPYGTTHVWQIGAMGGLGWSTVDARDARGPSEAAMSPGLALSLEAGWRRELNPWLELEIGLRFARAYEGGVDRFSPPERGSGAPRSLDARTVSAPVRVTFGKAWPRKHGAGFWKSPFRGSFGAGPMLGVDALTLADGRTATSTRVGACLSSGIAQRTPYSRAIDDVFIEADYCASPSSRALGSDVTVSQALFFVGYHLGWPISRRDTRASR